MSGTQADPWWSLEAADQALASATAERDRISAALVALDTHPTRQILDTASLAGTTRAAWAAAKDAAASIWEEFAAYAALVDQANQLRGQRTRPDQRQLSELRRLFCEDSVEVAVPPVMGFMPALPGPAHASIRMRPAAVVDRINAAYTRIADVITGVDAVWAHLLPRLDRAEQAKESAAAQAREIDPATVARLSALETPLGELRLAIISDPMSLSGGARGLDAVEAELAVITGDLAKIVAIRNDLAERLARIESVVRKLAEVEQAAAQTREATVSRISGITLPPVTAEAAGLRQRIQALGATPPKGEWLRLANDVDAVEAAARTALDEAESVARRVAGPLRLRDELRGRLEAYHGKALALGLAEDAGLAALYRQVHGLLWSAPCDIGAALSAVDRYQQEITGRRR